VFFKSMQGRQKMTTNYEDGHEKTMVRLDQETPQTSNLT
jgi:hypothetical protein